MSALAKSAKWIKAGHQIIKGMPSLKRGESVSRDGITVQRRSMFGYRIWITGEKTMFDLYGRFQAKVREWEPPPKNKKP